MSDNESDSSNASVDASYWVKHDDKNIKTIAQMYKEGILKSPVASPLDTGADQASSTAADSADASVDPASQSAPTAAGGANTKTFPPNPSLLERVCVL
jgi:hypothetical protein